MKRSAPFAASQTVPVVHSLQGLQSPSVLLLGRNPYSANDPVRMHTMGIALERQRGVHAIGSDVRQDYDTWPGTAAYTPPGVDVFSESEAGGEYLVVRWHPGQAPRPPAAGAGGRIHWAGHAEALRCALHLRRLVLAPLPDAMAIEQGALDVVGALSAHGPDGADGVDGANGAGNKSARADHHLRRTYGRVLDRIASDFAQPLTIAQLAQAEGKAPLRFLREFTRLVGMTPHAFLIETRLQAARAMVQRGTVPLAAVAHDCGFTHQSHMGVAFRKVLGPTPGQYLAAMKAVAP